MTSHRRWFTGLAAGLPVVLAAALGSPAAAADEPTPALASAQSRPAAQAVLRVGSQVAPTLVGPLSPPDITVAAATFQVTYTGFTPAARAAFQRAVNLWAPQITSSVPITVSASFEQLPAGVLGSAGSNFIHRNFAGAPAANTWYPDAIANKRAGTQLNPGADIVARFSANRTDWHFGTAAAPAGTIDFTSVVMHELGHGLGFFGAGRVTGTTGSVRFQGATPRDPIAYDRFTENAGGALLVGFPDNSAQLANQLRSNNLRFDSPRVRAANGGQPARIYAPMTFQPGSSYSHLNEATFAPGTPNSLMTPVINFGETIRNPGAITRAIFLDIGW